MRLKKLDREIGNFLYSIHTVRGAPYQVAKLPVDGDMMILFPKTPQAAGIEFVLLGYGKDGKGIHALGLASKIGKMP
jgi:hypothetical protein